VRLGTQGRTLIQKISLDPSVKCSYDHSPVTGLETPKPIVASSGPVRAAGVKNAVSNKQSALSGVGRNPSEDDGGDIQPSSLWHAETTHSHSITSHKLGSGQRMIHCNNSAGTRSYFGITQGWTLWNRALCNGLLYNK